MSIFLTILSGVAVFVLGQTILKIFVEPWQSQRECVGKISHHLLLYANVYSNPGVGTDEINRDAANEARKLAAELISICRRIPFYERLSKFNFFPSIEIVLEVQKNLIGLSNSTHDGDPTRNAGRTDRIKELLGIRFAE